LAVVAVADWAKKENLKNIIIGGGGSGGLR
jgi:hypothetical protein